MQLTQWQKKQLNSFDTPVTFEFIEYLDHLCCLAHYHHKITGNQTTQVIILSTCQDNLLGVRIAAERYISKRTIGAKQTLHGK